MSTTSNSTASPHSISSPSTASQHQGSTSKPPSTSTYTLTPHELSRKRARDRKSQRAMRDRQKLSLLELQSHVSQLSSTLTTQAATFHSDLLTYQSQIAALHSQIQGLTEENRRLKEKVEESRFVGSELSLENFRFPENAGGALGDLPVPRPVSYPSPPRPREATSPGGYVDMGNSNPVVNIVGGKAGRREKEVWEAIPMTCPPTCLSDRILQNYIEARRAGINTFTRAGAGLEKEMGELGMEEEHPAWLPDINALLAPNTPEPGVDGRSVSTVVSDILLSYHEINTLPRKVAVLYIMYKLLNWLIYRTKSTYDQMPLWLRPTSSQLNTPHPSWIDRIPWPTARTYLITHPHITFDDFAMVYSSSFDVSWPYSPSHIIESTSTGWSGGNGGNGGDGGGISLNPVYEQHLRQLKNWTVGEKFRRKFPELSGIIDADGEGSGEIWP
ncbi:hypothetical protein BGZ60DRAFT_527808 [Tricladium varicosporioides]|nr:hypothetical protein BGZ60DRAFT_527808 [Hymenoscyphus varicosporioides]